MPFGPGALIRPAWWSRVGAHLRRLHASSATTNTLCAAYVGGGELYLGWECPNDSCLRDGEETPEIPWPFEDTGRFSQLEELGFRIL